MSANEATEAPAQHTEPALAEESLQDLAPPAEPPAPASSPAVPTPESEQRNFPRHGVRWHVDAQLDGGIHRGSIREISTGGATLFLEVNPGKSGTRKLSLHIHVPPFDVKHREHIVEVECRIVYSLHDSREQTFRIGLQFTHFRNAADQTLLQNRLQGY